MKEITITTSEYKELVRCKALVELSKPAGIIMQTDSNVTFTPLTTAERVELEKEFKERINTANTLKDFYTTFGKTKSPEPEDYGNALKTHCRKCLSTSHRKGFLGLFGERVCDNTECDNSKSKFV